MEAYVLNIFSNPIPIVTAMKSRSSQGNLVTVDRVRTLSLRERTIAAPVTGESSALSASFTSH